MKIAVRSLKENQPHVFEEDLNAEDLDIDVGIMHYPNDLQLKVEAWKSKNDLTIQAHIEGERYFTCSLCLEEFNNLFEKDMTLHYDIKGKETVSIDDDIREEIILDHPIRILCREDCRGLCLFCGTNLNKMQCDCKGE